jgi:hypothetical protein
MQVERTCRRSCCTSSIKPISRSSYLRHVHRLHLLLQRCHLLRRLLRSFLRHRTRYIRVEQGAQSMFIARCTAVTTSMR